MSDVPSLADLRSLFAYGAWANARLFGAMADLPADDFARPLGGGEASLRSTLVHAMSAEWGWTDRCGGPARGPALVPDDFPTVAAVRTQWLAVESHVRTFLDGLAPDDVHRPVTFALGGGPAQAHPLGALMRHGALHSIHHRAQASLLLRLLGRSAGNIDYLFFLATP